MTGDAATSSGDAPRRTPLRTLPLRVLVVAPTPYFSHRGCHVRIWEECRALIDQDDVHIELVTYPHGDDTPPLTIHRTLHRTLHRASADTSHAGSSRARMKRSPGPSWTKPLLDIALCVTLLKTALKLRPHILHAHLHEGAAIAWPASRLLRIPLVLDYQGSLADELTAHGLFSPRGWLARLVRRAEGFIESSAARILLSNRVFFPRLSPRALRRPERITPLTDALDTSVFEPATPETTNALVTELRLPASAPRIVYLGVLDTYQGTDILLKAFARLIRHMKHTAHLVLCGYPNEARYRALADELYIGEHVTVVGEVPYPQALHYLALGDIAVAPKVAPTESNGKLLTYLAAGLPTIAFELPVNRELMGDAGVYAPYRDESQAVPALADAMACVLDDAQLRESLSDKARERSRAFAPDRMSYTLLRAYTELVLSE